MKLKKIDVSDSNNLYDNFCQQPASVPGSRPYYSSKKQANITPLSYNASKEEKQCIAELLAIENGQEVIINGVSAVITSNSKLKEHPFGIEFLFKHKLFTQGRMSAQVLIDQILSDWGKLIVQPITFDVYNFITRPQDIEFQDKHIAMTSYFNYGWKSKIVEHFVKLGAFYDKTINNRTHLLVIGEKDFVRFSKEYMRSKIEYALHLQFSGYGIKIILESDFLKILSQKTNI